MFLNISCALLFDSLIWNYFFVEYISITSPKIL